MCSVFSLLFLLCPPSAVLTRSPLLLPLELLPPAAAVVARRVVVQEADDDAGPGDGRPALPLARADPPPAPEDEALRLPALLLLPLPGLLMMQ